MKMGLIRIHITFAILALIQVNIYAQETSSSGSSNDQESADVELFPDQEPSFKGGMAEMQKYIQNNIHYPEEAIDLGAEGKIYISFIVTKRGSISQVKIERGAHPLLNEEAIRLIRNMPKWIPAKKNGKRVNSKMMLPIVFKLS